MMKLMHENNTETEFSIKNITEIQRTVNQFIKLAIEIKVQWYKSHLIQTSSGIPHCPGMCLSLTGNKFYRRQC